jgi:hypothetical protein
MDKEYVRTLNIRNQLEVAQPCMQPAYLFVPPAQAYLREEVDARGRVEVKLKAALKCAGLSSLCSKKKKRMGSSSL